MKVRIAYTIDVSDEYRRAINAYYGRDGLASREEVVRWTRQYGRCQDDDLMWKDPEPGEFEAICICGKLIEHDDDYFWSHVDDRDSNNDHDPTPREERD